MKNYFKVFLTAMLSMVFLFVVSNSFVATPENPITPIDGASIRMKTERSEQGLRFSAKLDESVKDNEHGFYLVFGETTVAELQASISAANGDGFYINNKNVFRVVVDGVNDDNQFSVILTGIPDEGYFDELTAIAFVVIGGVERFAPAAVSRSIAQVAIKMANDGQNIDNIVEVHKIVDSDRKQVFVTASGDVQVSQGIYELNPVVLKEEFLKDWNRKFGTALEDMDADAFVKEAKKGALYADGDSKDLSVTNLYKFFRDEKLANKWSWLLDYMIDQCDIVHPSNQAMAIKGDGTFGVNFLWNGHHLAYSISNFFNNEDKDGGRAAINFSCESCYDSLDAFNRGVYVNLKGVKFYKEGDEYRLPTPKDRHGYRFEHYQNSLRNYSPGDAYMVTHYIEILKAIYKPIDYTVKFYDGANQLGGFNATYNIEMELALPQPTKEGYIFLGWYDNSSLVGEATEKIQLGEYGTKNFYAKWEKVDLPDPEPTDADLALEAKDALQLSYASGDSVGSVTKDLTLPLKGLHDAVISWASSNAAVISNVGVVARAQANTNVTLTATIKVGAATETKQFVLTVKAAEPVVDPNQEYTIVFNLNGGAWPTTGGTPGYTNRDTMIKDFLTDFYNFLKPAGVSLNDFMHGAGKTSGFDGKYPDYVADLRELNVKTVNPGTGKFVNQEAYNKWVPLIDLMDEYTGINAEQKGQFWSSDWVAGTRFKPFVLKQNLWGANGEAAGYAEIAGRIPDKLKGSTPGVAITVPSKYKSTDEITLPSPTKASDNFLGWYDNADYQGAAVTKIAKGSSGNKVFYARYTSTVVPEKPKTDAEKMAEAKAALVVGYSSGDNANSVKGKVTLAAKGKNDVAVTWASSNVAVISNAGVVTRSKDGDVTVTLTATLKVGSLTETKVFTLKVIKVEPEPDFYTIKFVLNGGAFVISGYKNKTELADAFLADLYAFVKPSENLATFKHGAGKTSGFDGLWFSNDDYKAKIYGAGVKSGNNNYFLSHSTYQAKWKPFADMMVEFVKVGNAEQDFWASPYTGIIRMRQYFTNTKPGGAWSDDDMAMMPKGLSATVIPDKYTKESATITFPSITRNGYEFEGWYDNAAFTGTKVTSIPKGSTGNKTLYAKWGEVTTFKITYHLNSGAFTGYSNKTQIFNAFTQDLFDFIKPGGTVTAFRSVWFTNEDYKNKIYAANVKSGNNNYFLSSSAYQAKWKPLADFMVQFVKVGNPDQDFWSSPYTGTLRLKQYFANEKPGGAWSDADMNKLPSGLAANVYYQYDVNSPAITLPTATRSGYTFEGWYTANTGGTKVTSIAKGSTGDKVFYARWKVIANPELNTIMNLITGGHRATLTKKSITYYGATNHAKSLYQFVNRYMFNEPLNIQRKMLSTARQNHPNATATKHWVVIHDTANTNASALANHNYMLNGAGGGYVSWHYTTGNDGIFQGMEETHRAYHAGDGSTTTSFRNTGIKATNPYLRPKLGVSNGNFTINGVRTSIAKPAGNWNSLGQWPVIINGTYHINTMRWTNSQVYGGVVAMNGGNYNSIGIESSVLRTDDIWWTWHKTAKLTADILVRRNLLPDRVAFHNNFDGKACPRTAITSGNINEWLEMIFLEYKIRKSYNSYKIGMVTHSSILNNKGRITSYPSATTSVSYTVTITAPNGATLSKKFTTSVRV